MTLKYLLVPMVALALGGVAPVTVAKGHHGHGKYHEKHEKRHHNKHSEEDGRRGLIRTEEHHDKHRHANKHEHDCDNNCGTTNHLPPLPNVNIPTVPKVNVSMPDLPRINPPTPHHPVDELIDKAAGDAKQKAREILSE